MEALEDEVVIVGMFKPKGKQEESALKERSNLVRDLTRAHVTHRQVAEMWPRDSFVYHEGFIHRQSQHGNYADGGYLLNFPGLVMCSAAISESEEETRDITGVLAYRTLKLWRLYRERAEVLPPPKLNLNETLVPHIDYVVLPVPQKRVLFVDEDYFLENKEDVKKFCANKAYNLETVYNDYENPTWPCNSLVIETQKGLTAFINSDSDGRFVHALERHGIIPIGIPFSTNCRLGGGIHCATNNVPRSYIDSALSVFYK